MTRIRVVAGLLCLSGMLAACGGSPPPPPAATSKPVATAATPAAPAPVPMATSPVAAVPSTPKPSTPAPTAQAAPLVATPAVPQGDGTSYEPKGRRDPFMPLDLTGGPKGLEVATTKLTGIVRGANTTLALVEAQDGIGYILKPGDTLGDGRLVEIGIDTVVFAVASRPGAQSNRVVLRLAAN
jgi:Tfp pilus assembly protein PilP